MVIYYYWSIIYIVAFIFFFFYLPGSASLALPSCHLTSTELIGGVALTLLIVWGYHRWVNIWIWEAAFYDYKASVLFDFTHCLNICMVKLTLRFIDFRLRGLLQHCLSGWSNKSQYTLPPPSSLDLRSSLNLNNSTMSQNKELEVRHCRISSVSQPKTLWNILTV